MILHGLRSWVEGRIELLLREVGTLKLTIRCKGGTPESQREFLESFSADTSNDPNLVNGKRKGKTPPIANQFALGYTYRDVLDADQEGMCTDNRAFPNLKELTFG